jgi:hypothetical protein
MLQCQSKRLARAPCHYFWVNLIVSVILSAIGSIFGDFSVSANNGGWQSCGTLIANRQTQLMLVQYNADALFVDDEDGVNDVWKEMITNVQPGWEDDDDGGGVDDQEERCCCLVGMETSLLPDWSWKDMLTPKASCIHLLSGSVGSSSSSSSISWMGGNLPHKGVTTTSNSKNRPLPLALNPQ